MKVLRLAKLLSACAVVIGLTLPAAAQEFPSRIVKIVMGFGPGGLGDIAGRAIGEVMSKSIGQPVIIENMPGAGGATAALAVARAHGAAHRHTGRAAKDVRDRCDDVAPHHHRG
jgi:tripartite-type tricarboxylate transporter receptor subunit TctC